MTFRRPMLTAVGATALLATAAPSAVAADELADRPAALDPVVRLADRAHDRAVTEHVRLYRLNQRLRGVQVDRDRRTEVADWSTHHLRERNRELRASNRRERREQRRAERAGSAGGVVTGGSTASAGLEAIAACESGGDPSAVSADGTYRGKYQFDQQTWQSVGGSGDPAAAPEAEQDKRAAMLQAQSGSSPWPTCG